MAILQVLEVLVGGILQGGIYALAATGLSLVYGVTRFLNLAHGTFVMIGGLLTFLMFNFVGSEAWWIPFALMIPIAGLMFGLGVLVEIVLVEPSMERAEGDLLEPAILITLGLAFMLRDLTREFVLSTDFGISFYLGTVEAFGLRLQIIKLIAMGMIGLTAIVLTYFLRETYLGLAIRAVSQNRKGTMAVGINLENIMRFTMGIGSSLAAIAGVFIVIVTVISPEFGLPFVAKLVTIIVLGGLGSLVGTFVGALLVGVSESMVGFFIGPGWSPTVAYFILIGILVVRPQGIFGSDRQDRF